MGCSQVLSHFPVQHTTVLFSIAVFCAAPLATKFPEQAGIGWSIAGFTAIWVGGWVKSNCLIGQVNYTTRLD